MNQLFFCMNYEQRLNSLKLGGETWRLLGLVLKLLLGLCLAGLYGQAWASCDRPLTIYRGVNTSSVAIEIHEKIGRIFDRAGCALLPKRIEGSSERVHRTLANGELDVLIEASVIPERLHYAYFSDPYRVEFSYLFVLKEREQEFQIAKLEDLANESWRIFDQNNAWYGQDWQRLREQKLPKNQIIMGWKWDDMIRSLKLRRADMIISTDLSINTHFIESSGLVPLPLVVHSEPVSIMFSRKSVPYEWLEDINEAIAAENNETALEQ